MSFQSREGDGFGRDGRGAPEDATSSVAGAILPAAAVWTRRAGAAVSVALVLGVLVWGYRISVRQAEGVPVIHAEPGPARLAPEDPGGDLARHVGLSVNEVAAEGMAAPGPEKVVLAPDPEQLAPGDTPMTGVQAIPEIHRDDPVLPEEAAPANQPTAEVEQAGAIAVDSEALPGDATTAEAGDAAGAEDAQKPKTPVAVVPLPEQPFEIAVASPDDLVPSSVPGVKVSPRPGERPFKPLAPTPVAAAPSGAATGVSAAEATSPAASPKPVAAPDAATVTDSSSAAASVEVDPGSVAAGQRVAQIGAFDSPDAARTDWDRIAARFPKQMAGKQRTIQEAVSGGRKFYRLRAVGFADVGEARAFCAALVAGNANCIPTVMN